MSAAPLADPAVIPPTARIENLSVELPGPGGSRVRALRGVSLDLRQGEVTAVVGESGSGKSMLALSLLGLLPEQAETTGRVDVLGVDMLDESPRGRRARRALLRTRMGAVFQDTSASLDPTMRIGKQLLRVAGGRDRALAALADAGVPDPASRWNVFPHQLSGGLRQRVMIALALARDPALIIADEPTTALDATVQRQVIDRLRRIAVDRGCGIVLITHDLGVAGDIADRIVVLYAGRVVEDGPAGQVLDRPAHPYTAALLATRHAMEVQRAGQLTVLAGALPDPTAVHEGCVFAPRCSSALAECRIGPEPDPAPIAEGRASACRPAVDGRIDPTDWAATSPRIAPVAPVAPELDLRTVLAPGESVIEVRGAGRTFRVGRAPRRALHDVDLTIRSGESVAIVGESGSGKSTLLRVLAGLERVDVGTVTRSAPAQMLYQDSGGSLTPWLSIGTQIADGVRGPRRLPLAQVAEETTRAMATVALDTALRPRRPRSLSGGQRQRASLARAVATRPALLLCDEPTSALDASSAAAVLNGLAELRERLGLALVVVTHDMAVARAIADRIVVVKDGAIVEEGDTATVLGDPDHSHTRELIAAIPTLPGRTRGGDS